MSEDSKTPALEMNDADVVAMKDTTLTVVEGVNWTVLPGEFWVVGGQEYSGKSDLLMLAAGLIAPGRGNCRIFGTETSRFGEAEVPERLRVGFVFEGGQLFNQLTVAENIALPLRYQKDLTLAEALSEMQPLMDLMELAPLADVTPPNVATNWRQRASLARALVLKPELLLLDNPQGGLARRHLHWWLRFLDQLWHGHEWFGGKPMTIVATADDLRPWKSDARKFSLLRDKKFLPLGSWNDVGASSDPIVKELLAGTVEAII